MTAPRDPVVVGVALRDDDTAPLALGSALAALTGASLVLLHASPFQPRAEVQGRLRQIASQLPRGLDVVLEIKDARSPVRALHESAEELGASMLVAGASELTGAGVVAPGGVGERLLHAAPCAVAIAPRGYAPPGAGMRRIGVAFVDGPEGRDALAVATGLARRAGGSVTSYTVLETAQASERLERIIARVKESVPAEMLRATEVLEGDPADQLTAISAGVDLLICGSRGYGPVRSTLVGGVSSRLAHTASCPLLVIPRAPVAGLGTLTGRGTAAVDR